ncbi:hypothetical protein NLU13_1849 [Sarocladium strictum]|uniref:Zn(2)-C6 fungal-type domain-containing protein n=1 Tax=Sarocladium strictum TaxID=5046 RepID=A0AA39GSH4_SARSR|nr:hypothetical protein NLU13_1849 [Sarocladium strictum]
MPDDDASSRASSKGAERAVSEASAKSDDGTPVKRGRRSRPKVKTGCANCKQRRIKCDEARPSCTQCVKSHKICTGYPPPPRSARPEYEVRIAPKPAVTSQGSAPTAPAAAAATAAAAMTPSSVIPIISEPPQAAFLRRREVMLPPRRTGHRDAQSAATSSPAPEASSSAYPLPSGAPSFGTDSFYFQVFQEQTANELSGFFDSAFYTERVLEACRSEPAIRHAAVALGALYQNLVQSRASATSPSSSAQEQEEQARHWHVAVRHQNSLRTQLMASVLLASFDSFIGDHRQAIVQIQNGLDMLERIRTAERLPAYGVATDTAEEELTVIFMRLAIQAKSYDLGFHFPEPYVVRFTLPAQHQARLQQLTQQQRHPELDPGLYVSRLSPGGGIESKPASPARSPSPFRPFSSVQEARIAHDRLNERHVRLQEALSIRPRDMPRVPIPEPWARAINSFKGQLAAWSEAFQPLLLSRRESHVGRRERAGIIVLWISHLTSAVIGAIQFSSSEMIFDDYSSLFQSINDMALELLREEEAAAAVACHAESPFCHHQRQLPADYINAGIFSPCHMKPTFSMDMGIVAPLFMVATKCRVPLLRRQAIELLRGCSRREGMWDSELTARIASWVMSVEEASPHVHGSYTDPSSYHSRPSEDPTRYQDRGLLLSSQPYVAVPSERRVMVKTVDFDLRARWANVAVGTRNLPDSMPDPRYRSTQITW